MFPCGICSIGWKTVLIIVAASVQSESLHLLMRVVIRDARVVGVAYSASAIGVMEASLLFGLPCLDDELELLLPLLLPLAFLIVCFLEAFSAVA